MTTGEADLVHELAEARLAVYGFLRAALNKPTPAQHAWMQQPDFQRALDSLCDQFGAGFPGNEVVPSAYADFESRYIACFEVGLPAPPVALQASHYNRREPVPAIIHEHILFYKRFGLQLRDGDSESADHLLHELAFLLHLDQLLVTGKMSADSLSLARRDFLDRHLSRWLSRAADAAEEKHLPALYQTLLTLLTRAVNQDRELTSSSLTQSITERP
jgi:DMSO reductase family type II enzyme chaperone